MKIGIRIKEIRESKRYSQSRLAQLIGVTQPTVSDWESGKTEPTVDNMKSLAVEFGVYFEWLATGRTPKIYKPNVEEPGIEYRVERETPPDEAALMDIFRRISEKKRTALIRFLKDWV